MSRFTYETTGALPDGSPCTLTWLVWVIRGEASQGGGLGVDDLCLDRVQVTGPVAKVTLGEQEAEAAFGPAWVAAYVAAVSAELDDGDVLQCLVDDANDSDGGWMDDDCGPYGGEP